MEKWLIIKSKVQESWSIMMADFMKAHGKMITKMVLAIKNLKISVNTKDNMHMENLMVSENINGLMASFMKDNGKMA